MEKEQPILTSIERKRIAEAWEESQSKENNSPRNIEEGRNRVTETISSGDDHSNGKVEK